MDKEKEFWWSKYIDLKDFALFKKANNRTYKDYYIIKERFKSL